MSQVWPSVVNLAATNYTVVPRPPTVESESPPAPRWCHCIIDLSTPATLERDFYAWLNGDEAILRQTAPCCVFASSSTVQCQPNYGNYYMPKSDSDDTNPCSVSSSSTNSNNNENAEQKRKPRNRRKLTATLDKGRGTNLYGRPYCPGRPLCMDERFRIIQFFQAGMKVNAISKQLCISHGCVSKIITRYRETGLLVPSSHSQYRRKRRKTEKDSS
uniref:Paired domain-containing protein n=1 Tax=Panagrellus redivivus TaxID=6233 RepID=A0A7E4W444_PANRE